MNLVVSNTMSIEEHVQRINQARDKVQIGIFEMAESITDAVKQLEGRQIELAQQLGMSKGTLSKWVSIGSNRIIMNMRQEAPSSFNSLYQLSSLDNQYVKYYGEKEGEKKFVELFENKKITALSDRNDVAKIIKNHKNIVKQGIDLEIEQSRQSKLDRTKAIIKSEIKLNVLVKSNLIYNTIIVIPTYDQLLKWKHFQKEEFINTDYPIGSLENLDKSIFQQCLIKIKVQDIELGLRCLRSWGFDYGDILMPNQPKKGLASMPLEYVLLKGQKGNSQKVDAFVKSDDTFDLINYAEKTGVKPFLLVGEVTASKGWVYCVG
jgi:hypothetical protein|tara:strand:+ start:200 stop:1159 length:960 start_codon:yes stop_codon:yes gene_type:complete